MRFEIETDTLLAKAWKGFDGIWRVEIAPSGEESVLILSRFEQGDATLREVFERAMAELVKVAAAQAAVLQANLTAVGGK